MALRNFRCNVCSTEGLYFDTEVDKVCEKCGSKDMKRLMSVPLDAKHTDKIDKYHNVNAQQDIQIDARKRSVKHTNDTIDDLIAELGEEECKKAGFLVYDSTTKKWRKRNDFDTNTIGARNSATAPKGKKVK